MKPLLKIFNECRSVTGVGELNPYRRSSTNVWENLKWCPINLWSYGVWLGELQARSWASRAAGDRSQQTWTGHAEQLLPNENGAKKVGKTVAASGHPEFMGRRPSSKSPSGALRCKPKSSRQWFWAQKWLKKRWLHVFLILKLSQQIGFHFDYTSFC